MVKRGLIVLVLCLIPLLSFADLGLGGAAFFNSPVLIGQDTDTSGLWSGGLTFGGDLRWKFLKILQLEALGLVTTKTDATALDLYTDVGLAFDLWILRLSAGAGPNFTYVFGGGDDPAMFGCNIKVNADIKIKRLSLGLSYITGLVIDGGIAWDKSTGMLGASILFWL
jgi:hypothetical protein